MLYYVTTILIGFLLILYLYFKRCYTYWERKNVPHPKPTIPFGTSENPFKQKTPLAHQFKKLYDEFKAKGFKHIGLYFYTSPLYFVIDFEYVKSILSKDFSHFTDRGAFSNEDYDPLSANLVNQGGTRWGILRKKLTPAFTSGKMKMMFPTLVECSKQLEEAVDRFNVLNKPINIKEFVSCYIINVIGSCGFGIECNSFIHHDNEFHVYANEALTIHPFRWITRKLLTAISPKLANFLNITLTPKHITNFFLNVVKSTVSYREKNGVQRKDFLQILMELQEDKERLSINEMAANTYMFFVAGHDTSTMTMSFCLYELARNTEIQTRVREEIAESLQKHHKLSYESIGEMTYLTQVIYETLRMYPPASAITRVCVKDYTIPDTSIVIEKGTVVFIPAFGIHFDPDYYPDPEKFDPERFSKENSAKRSPFLYLPFGEGPRICIGIRFGLMQMKVGLVTLLKKYAFSISEKTEVPIQLDPNNITLAPKNGVWLNIHEI